MSTLSYFIDLDTELSAVNSILGSIGQAPITSLEFENPEIAFIYKIYQDTIVDVQSEGWSFNTFYNVKFSPDTNKHILTPNNILRIDYANNQFDRTWDLISIDGKLYDKYTQTDEFNNSIYLDYVQVMDWADLPIVFKRYIIARASVRAATQMVTNRELAALLATQESFLRASCIEYECNQGDYSYMGQPNGTIYQSYQPYRALQRY